MIIIFSFYLLSYFFLLIHVDFQIFYRRTTKILQTIIETEKGTKLKFKMYDQHKEKLKKA